MGDHEGRNVLIIDDDDDLRHALRLLFEFEDFQVVGEAKDGLEAVALARALKPDFALVDQSMPRMPGDEAANLIRALSPETRIVAFSAVLSRKPEWADAYLNKERIVEVVPLLRYLIDGSRTGVA